MVGKFILCNRFLKAYVNLFRCLISIMIILACELTSAAANPVSLVKLIATPEPFDGKAVSTIGWLLLAPNGEHPMAKLYLSKEDLEFDNYSYEIRIDLTRERMKAMQNLNRKMVIIDGTFKNSIFLSIIPSSAIIEVSKIRAKEKWSPLKLPIQPKKGK